MEPLEVGNSVSGSVVAAPEHFASRIVPGTPDVFSTASLCSLVEKTAADWVATRLAPGQTSVGAEILIRHTAATPAGLTIRATVKLVAAEGRRYDFEWSASDGVDEVGSGTHQRFAVDLARFLQRLDAKRTA